MFYWRAIRTYPHQKTASTAQKGHIDGLPSSDVIVPASSLGVLSPIAKQLRAHEHAYYLPIRPGLIGVQRFAHNPAS